MKAVKIIAIVFGAYVALVAAFESSLGYLQPTSEGTLVISVTDERGDAHSRVVSRLESGGHLYVAANHWPRAWYRQALEHPEVQVVQGGATADYRAVPVTGDEHDRVNGENRLPFVVRVLTGFPPRYFLRLDPR